MTLPLMQWVRQEFKVSRIIYANGMAHSASQYMNHFLVTLFLGLELTGVYVFFQQAISAMYNLVLTGVIQMARPKLVKAVKQASENYTQLHKHYVKRTLLVSIGMALCALPCMYVIVFYLLQKPLSKEWFAIFPIMLLYFVLVCQKEMNNVLFYSQHRDSLILKLSIISALVYIGLNTGLILSFGLWGCAVGLVMIMVIDIVLQRRSQLYGYEHNDKVAMTGR